MIKGIDYTGITVSFYCHDGQGNYVMHLRGANCRDEHGKWDFGGGGLEFNETFEDCLVREIQEEYGVTPLEYKFLGYDEVFREHEGKPTHWISFRYKVLVDRTLVINNEPDKHEKIGWFTMDNLPTPLHSQVFRVFEKYKADLL